MLRPLGFIPFPAFAAAWTTVALLTYWWLLRPLAAPARVASLLAGFTFALNGNVEWLLALMVVIGVTYPSAWLLAAFTKITPFLGFGWYVLWRDWLAVRNTILIGAMLVGITAVLMPDAWGTWIAIVGQVPNQPAQAGPLMPLIPLAPRLVAAAGLVAWGAWRRQPTTLPLVLILAQPDLEPWMLGYLAALPRLWRTSERAAIDEVGTAALPSCASPTSAAT